MQLGGAEFRRCFEACRSAIAPKPGELCQSVRKLLWPHARPTAVPASPHCWRKRAFSLLVSSKHLNPYAHPAAGYFRFRQSTAGGPSTTQTAPWRTPTTQRTPSARPARPAHAQRTTARKHRLAQTTRLHKQPLPGRPNREILKSSKFAF